MLATKIIGIDFGTKRKRVVAYTFGPRSDETCRWLPSLVGHF
jgi:insertion element IS1 protein InsB